MHWGQGGGNRGTNKSVIYDYFRKPAARIGYTLTPTS